MTASGIDFDGEFRERWRNRRQIAVELVKLITQGADMEWELERVKTASHYDRLNSKDRANLRVFFSEIRWIIGSWNRLRPYEREWFLDNRIVYSTLAKRAREVA